MNLLETLNENLNPLIIDKELKKIETDAIYRMLNQIKEFTVSESDVITIVIQADGCSVGIDEIFELTIDRNTILWYYFQGENVNPYINECEEWKSDKSFLRDVMLDNIHDVTRLES